MGEMFKSRSANQSGFILITLAVAILVLGLMLSAYLYMLEINRRQMEMSRTDQAFSSTMHKFANYLSSHGHLPCPAARDLSPGDDGYGIATDCTAQDVSPGSCAHGYCVAVRDGARVRTGIVPFVTLKIPRDDAVDANGNFLTYALTERQGTPAYSDGGGVIEVVERDADGTSLSRIANFVLVSHGEDGAGAWRPNGSVGPKACVEGNRDGENCDLDAVFVRAPFALASGEHYFDDQVEYVLWDWTYIWDFTYGDQAGSYSRGGLDSYIGVGTNNPHDKLHVGTGGNLQVEDGALSTKALCDQAGADCFGPEALGGDVSEGKGMNCPQSSFMIGIKKGRPVCGSIFSGSSSECPEGSFLAGVSFSSANGFSARCVNAITGASTEIRPQ